MMAALKQCLIESYTVVFIDPFDEDLLERQELYPGDRSFTSINILLSTPTNKFEFCTLST
jgi:hypothetical protein